MVQVAEHSRTHQQQASDDADSACVDYAMYLTEGNSNDAGHDIGSAAGAAASAARIDQETWGQLASDLAAVNVQFPYIVNASSGELESSEIPTIGSDVRPRLLEACGNILTQDMPTAVSIASSTDPLVIGTTGALEAQTERYAICYLGLIDHDYHLSLAAGLGEGTAGGGGHVMWQWTLPQDTPPGDLSAIVLCRASATGASAAVQALHAVAGPQSQ
jgi:hypothetical protein